MILSRFGRSRGLLLAVAVMACMSAAVGTVAASPPTQYAQPSTHGVASIKAQPAAVAALPSMEAAAVAKMAHGPSPVPASVKIGYALAPGDTFVLRAVESPSCAHERMWGDIGMLGQEKTVSVLGIHADREAKGRSPARLIS